jgi:hypothetical protein
VLSRVEMPAMPHVSRAEPEVGVPPSPLGRGAHPTTLHVLAGQRRDVRLVAERKDTGACASVCTAGASG